MVKVQSLVALSLLVAPALATSGAWEDLNNHFSKQHPRELSNQESIFAREADFDSSLFSRTLIDEDDLEIRELDLQDLSERSKIGNFFKKIWHGIKKVASVILRRDESEDSVLSRDFDELDTREFEELFERYLDELQMEGREFDDIDFDLVARDFEDGLNQRGIEDEVFDGRAFEFQEREMDDLD